MKSIKDIPSLLATLEFLDHCNGGEPLLETPTEKGALIMQTVKSLFPKSEAVIAPQTMPTPINGDTPPSSLPRKVAPLLKKTDEHVAEAMAQADAAQTLAELKKAMDGFDGCALKHTATTTVFADGNPKASIMVVGEAPGADEDRAGLPFVGASGQLLDRMMAAIGLNRAEHLYITNVIPWRPPGNRPPTREETLVCLPFLRRHIALHQPKFLICVGATAAQAVLNIKDGMSQVRGKILSYEGGDHAPIPTAVLFHPAYLIRSPSHKRHAWEDLLKIQGVLPSIVDGLSMR